MTITIELPKGLERQLSAEAKRLGLPLPEYALKLLSASRDLAAPPATGAELVAYWRKERLIGSRPEIVDSQEHARELRNQAEQRR